MSAEHSRLFPRRPWPPSILRAATVGTPGTFVMPITRTALLRSTLSLRGQLFYLINLFAIITWRLFAALFRVYVLGVVGLLP